MGIIAATKLHYRASLLLVRVLTMEVVKTLRAQAKAPKMAAGTAGLAQGHPAHVLDAAELFHEAMEDISPEIILPGDIFCCVYACVKIPRAEPSCVFLLIVFFCI